MIIDFHTWLSTIRFYTPLFSAIGISILLAVATQIFIYSVLLKRLKKTDSLLNIFFQYMKGPLYIILPLFYITILASILDFSTTSEIISLITKVLFTIAISWSILRLIDYSDILILRKYQDNDWDPKTVLTKSAILKNVGKIIIIILAISLLLLSFDSVRELGKGILLSAGVLGGIIALGAQQLFSNVISGFQIAFTTPLKIGDTLVIEGELGNVEEVTLTNVVLCLWDKRRLVLPLTHLIQKPFINLTQPQPDLLGTLFVYADPKTVNVEKLREAFTKILETSPLWDKKAGKLEVTDWKENSIQLRALVSAANNNDLWNLSCYAREKMLEFIRTSSPESLVKWHAQIDAEVKDNSAKNTGKE